MIKILFLIHDLGQGGAEKVLVNLVNNMDETKFDITVVTLFAGGVNEQFLKSHIHYYSTFKHMIPGNSKLMKLFSPEFLHRISVKGHYDIEVSYLEGPSARIVSGCKDKTTKLVSWVHSELTTQKLIAIPFRNSKEAIKCYNKFDKNIFVSEQLKNAFCNAISFKGECNVLYNTIETNTIKKKAEKCPEIMKTNDMKIIAVGTLKEVKGYDRLLRIAKKLHTEGYIFNLYILGTGPLENAMKRYISENGLSKKVFLLGYDNNPYQYVAHSDLFVCSSYSEGFSTAATESLVVGTPVCTVEVSGMREMLGNNEYGVITDNSEDALYIGIKKLMDNPNILKHYKNKALDRGSLFNLENTVSATEHFFNSLI